MNRRKFNKYLATIATSALGCSPNEEVTPNNCTNTIYPDKIENAKLIINTDGGDGFGKYSASRIEDFVKISIESIVRNAEYLFYGTGTSHIFSHKTKIGERFNNNLLDAMDKIGTDPLEIATNYTHSKNKKIFFSLRMNDTHDYIHDHLFPVWKKTNPNAIMGSKNMNFKYGGNRWSAMNYEKKITQKYILSLVDEVLANYEVDGIELDFFRHPIFFINQLVGYNVNFIQIEMMTDLITEISNKCKYKGKELAIRVPDSVGYCRKIGIDLEKWLERGLIDILTLAGYFHFSKWCSFSYLKKLGDFKIFACLSRSRLNYDGKSLDDYYWVNEAVNAIANDFDGIYLFNVTQNKLDHLHSILDPESFNLKIDSKYQEIKGNSAGYWVMNGKSFFTY